MNPSIFTCTRERDFLVTRDVENSEFPNASPLVKTGRIYSPTRGISFAINVCSRASFPVDFLPTDTFLANAPARALLSAIEKKKKRQRQTQKGPSRSVRQRCIVT